MRWLVIVFLFIGCTAKRTTTEKIVERQATKSFEYVSNPISTQIVIEEICDTLGKLRKFTKVEASGVNTASVKTKDNRLYLDLLTGISQTKTDTIYKTEYRDVKSEVVRYKIPFWVWSTLIGSISINLLLLYIFIRK